MTITVIIYLILTLFFSLSPDPALSVTLTPISPPIKPKASLSKRRSACRLFVWDGFAAIRYHLCNHLLKDCVYEGLGGKKFVRIRPGSLLEALYPPSDHGPDKCLLCGLTFHDHLKCWWYPYIYSSYDSHLDEVMNSGILYEPDELLDNNNQRKGIQNRNPKQGQKNANVKREYESGLNPFCHENDFRTRRVEKYNFHRKYVQEEEEHRNIPHDSREKKRKARLKHLKEGNELNLFEKRKMAGITYSVPRIKVSSKGIYSSSILVIARALVISKLDELLWIERFEAAS